MEKRITFIVKNEDEALQKAVEILNIHEDKIFVNVLNQTDEGFECEALVDVNLAFEGKKYLETILSTLNIEEFKVDAKSINNEQEVQLVVESNENPLLIGNHGRTLTAINFLVRSLIQLYADNKVITSVDIGNYREKRVHQLEIMATKIAKEVVSTKREVRLKPMDAYERRIVHAKLSEWRDVYTESEGSGKDRALVIKPVKK